MAIENQRSVGRKLVRTINAVLVFACLLPRLASAEFVQIYAPSYDPVTRTGVLQGITRQTTLDGVVGTNSVRLDNGLGMGFRAGVLSAAGYVELPGFDPSPTARYDSRVFDINAHGLAIGGVQKIVNFQDKGVRPVYWPSGAPAPVELPLLGLSSTGFGGGQISNVNDNRVGVGSSELYIGGVYRGTRPTRWDLEQSTITELGHLGLDAQGNSNAFAYDINNAGTVIGNSEKFVGTVSKGLRAVRWDAGSTVAIELGVLGTDSNGATHSNFGTLNESGTIVGICRKYVNGIDLGNRAIRWDAGSTVAIELAALGASASGVTDSGASRINQGGAITGFADKYENGANKGRRAVTWSPQGVILELANLGTDASGFATTGAADLNDAQIVAGSAQRYVNGVFQGDRAVYWNADGSVVDLNSLIDPASGWKLIDALSIDNGGWISGEGTFDPDGTGPAASYSTTYLMQVPQAAVPEPSLLLVSCAGLALTCARRRRLRFQIKRTA